MNSLEVSFRTARIRELDHDILPSALDLPDIVDLSGGERREGCVTGLRAMLLALLEDSIRCYLSPKERLRVEAERWIEGKHRSVPVSFEDVCASFGLEPGAARQALRQMRQRATHSKHLGRARPNVRPNRTISSRRRRVLAPNLSLA